MKMYINIIVLALIIAWPLFYLAEIVTWKSAFFDKLRKKIPLINRKPFTCTKCLSTWMMIFTLVSVFPFSILNYGIIMALSFIYFQIIQMQDKNDNLLEFNLAEPLSNYKYIRLTRLGEFGKVYKLKILIGEKEIDVKEFNSISDRENYILNFKNLTR